MRRVRAADLAAQAGAGAIATAAMTAVMIPVQRATDRGHVPPDKIVREGLRRAGVEPSREGRHLLTAFAHLAFGAAMGPLLAVLRRRRIALSGLPAPIHGALFGLGVWVVSYGGWAPALALIPPPQRDRPGRQAGAIAGHLVYGAVLGALLDRPAFRASPGGAGRAASLLLRAPRLRQFA
jgi:hypothetical protein